VSGELPRIALFEADPELLRHVVPEEAERARRALSVPLVVLPTGPFDPAHLFEQGSHTFAALVTSGLLTHEISFGGQPTLLLMGPGDLLHPTDLDSGMLPAEQGWAASGSARLALLDDRFLAAVRNWPRILTGLVERAAERHDYTLMQLAISQQPRVEDRLVALFRHLAERWGRVTPEGIVITLSLTHEALGRIIGARRPTVTLALKALAEDGQLRRRKDSAWVLHRFELSEPPGLTTLKGAAQPAFVGSAGNLADELRELRDLQGDLRDRITALDTRSAAASKRSERMVKGRRDGPKRAR
jgi:CRP-like cAMP-binding protein